MSEFMKGVVNEIEKLAFQIPPPNPYTPQIVSCCNALRFEIKALTTELSRVTAIAIAAKEYVERASGDKIDSFPEFQRLKQVIEENP